MEKNVSICATILFLYSRNYHNIVNLLYFNKIHLKHFFKRSQPDTLWQEDALGALSHRLALAVGRGPCETVSLSIQASGSDHSQRRDPASENRPAEPFLNPSSTNSWAKQHSGWFTPFSLGEPGIATECPVCQVIKSLKQELHPKTCQTLREARLGRPCPGQRWEQLDGISSRQHYQIPSGCWLWGAGVGVVCFSLLLWRHRPLLAGDKAVAGARLRAGLVTSSLWPLRSWLCPDGTLVQLSGHGQFRPWCSVATASPRASGDCSAFCLPWGGLLALP